MAIDDNAARNRVLVRTSWISTVGNAVLSAAKITVGALAGSLAVLGDGIDSATDVVISVVMIFTARIVGKPPTKKYPYGYREGGDHRYQNSFAHHLLCRRADARIVR